MTAFLLFSIPGLGILAAAVVVVYAIWRACSPTRLIDEWRAERRRFNPKLVRR